jgi:O-antigen/teichoic acid export membrane protein
MAKDRTISRKKTAWWGLLFHYASIGVSFVSGFIVLPISLKFIPLDLYGAWLASGNILIWLTVIDPGLGAVLQQRIGEAYGGKNYRSLPSLAWSGFAINGVIVAVIVMAGLVLTDFVPSLLKLPPSIDASLVKNAFAWAVAGTGLSFLAFAIAHVNVGLQATVGMGFPFFIVSLGSIALTVVLLYNGFGIMAAPFANVFRGGMLLIWNAGYLCWRFRSEGMSLAPSLGDVRGLLRLTTFTFASNSLGNLANSFDSFLVARVLGAGQVPILRATRTTIESFRPLVERPFVALMPALSHLTGSGELDKSRTVLLRLTVLTIWAVGLIGGGFLSLNDRLVTLWVGMGLFAGHSVNALLCLGFVVGSICAGLTNVCFSLGAIEKTSRIRTIQGVLQIFLMVMFGWYFGMLGIVAAPLLATVCVGGWMVPRLFGSLLKFERTEYLRLGRESLYAVAAAVAASLSVYLLRPTSWFYLSLCAFLFTVVFTSFLAAISSTFRAEVQEGWRFAITVASRNDHKRMAI